MGLAYDHDSFAATTMLEDCTFEFDFCMACACASWYAVGLRSLQLRPENPGSKVCMGLLVVVVVIVAVVSFFVCVFSVPFSFVYGFIFCKLVCSHLLSPKACCRQGLQEERSR